MPHASPSRGRFRPLLVALLGVLVLAGCSSAPSGGSGDGTPATPAASGTFPVTVEHKYGSTEITAEPKRVVTLGYTDPDALLAVGIAPVGIVDWFTQPPAGNKWLWQEQGFAGQTPEVVGVREEYQLEKIAALKPDLIIASYSGMTQEQYDQVSRIAPTVAQPKGFEDYTASWQVMTREITKAVGREKQGDELVAATEKKIADAKAAHPDWAQQTAVAVSYDTPNYFAFAGGDIKADLLAQLGFRAPEAITRAAAGTSEAQLSPEQAGEFDVDKLLVLAPTEAAKAEIEARPEFSRLTAVQQGRVLWMLSSERTEPLPAALSYGSVLSLPYALDKLVPELEALPAAQG
ncbi:iron-siderophore ABC transporter substrate-binding protein [Pseudonocardia sp. ICBG601]|uniref:ABC transporter substrate-binding protein n=1 Tax=Pseudonocardia sp. ICBG601 TaxID=2846759 RepID=UPI001CF66A16|nr:iron-siderophore ABC transporter substrate-binding protein [Pseudonocardia sp. ICBG601]